MKHKHDKVACALVPRLVAGALALFMISLSGCTAQVDEPSVDAQHDDDDDGSDGSVELGSTSQAQVFGHQHDCDSLRTVQRKFTEIETRNHHLHADGLLSKSDLSWADNAPAFSPYEQAMAHYMINGSRPNRTLYDAVNGSQGKLLRAIDIALFRFAAGCH
jgi:hypothetical protein